ncbi:hypothetical protein B0H15DRAFT_948116 [Mycena belliarum]|uniref:Uncharacterized protein n=1 Tax=Mycena belliarum TaxID=1033014 RepID=A0AAD6XW07_9AGAR|nr:hypothetical protein B0H15DRAFT_948116 [Mycena belliae]
MATPLDGALPPTAHDAGVHYDCRDCIKRPTSPELLGQGLPPMPIAIRDTDSDDSVRIRAPFITPAVYSIHGSQKPEKSPEMDPDSTPQHSQHLCLCFNLSVVNVDMDTRVFTSHLPNRIRRVLVDFLVEYAKELQLSDPIGFLRYRDENMFAKVFGLVKAQGYTLFVGIDDYDAPVRNRAVAHRTALGHDTFASVSDIMRLLDIHFWRPLLAGADIIEKLFVTGTLAVTYPALDELRFDSIPGLQLSCGFTEQEILDFSQSVLHSTPTVSELQRSCGGYIFPATEADRAAAQPLFHPELAMAQISLLYPKLPIADDPAFSILSDILKLLPEMPDVPGAVSLAALIDLLAAGAVQVDETNDETNAGFNSARVAWNDLYHAGGLTYDSQLVNTLRITNTRALSVIHAAVDSAFAAWHDLDLRLCFRTLSTRYIMSGEPESFVELFSQVLCDLGRASFGRRHEPTMHGVLELVMRNKHTTGIKMADPIIFPVPGNLVRVTGQLANVTHIWEPKTLTLQGMWRAANPNEDTPTVEALRTLHEEILKDNEEELLARPCMVWSSSIQAMEMRLVGDCLDPQPEPQGLKLNFCGPLTDAFTFPDQLSRTHSLKPLRPLRLERIDAAPSRHLARSRFGPVPISEVASAWIAFLQADPNMAFPITQPGNFCGDLLEEIAAMAYLDLAEPAEWPTYDAVALLTEADARRPFRARRARRRRPTSDSDNTPLFYAASIENPRISMNDALSEALQPRLSQQKLKLKPDLRGPLNDVDTSMYPEPTLPTFSVPIPPSTKPPQPGPRLPPPAPRPRKPRSAASAEIPPLPRLRPAPPPPCVFETHAPPLPRRRHARTDVRASG